MVNDRSVASYACNCKQQRATYIAFTLVQHTFDARVNSYLSCNFASSYVRTYTHVYVSRNLIYIAIGDELNHSLAIAS